MTVPDPSLARGVPRQQYGGYGLVIASELLLSELPAVATTPTPDVVIRHGALPELGHGEEPAGTRIGPFLWATAERFWLRVPGIARFRIAAGREIVVDLDPACDADGVRPFLLGTALGVLLMQRGNLILHGNAIRVGDGCVVCVGPSGAGKSTVAAGFSRRGFGVLADDLVMVDDRCWITPGVPRIKLWADAARAMAIDTSSLRRIRPNLEKFSYPVTNGFVGSASPARAIYSLGTTNDDAVSIERLDGFAKLGEVRANIYRPQFLEAMELRAQYLALCTRLAAAMPVARIARPVSGFTVDRLIDRLLDDLEQSG